MVSRRFMTSTSRHGNAWGVGVHQAQPAQAGHAGEGIHEFRQARPAGPEVGAVAGRVLGNQDDLPHAGRHQLLRLADDGLHRLAALTAPDRGDHAEGALMITAVGRPQVGVGPRGLQQARALFLAALPPSRQARPHLAPLQDVLHHPGDARVVGQSQEGVHAGKLARDVRQELLRQATDHDDAPQATLGLGGHELADGFLGLLARRPDEGTGVEHRDVGVLEGPRQRIALRPETPQDGLRVDEVAGAAPMGQGHLDIGP